MTALRALHITDRVYESERSPGLRLRFLSLQHWLQEAGFEVVHQPLTTTPGTSIARRLIAAIRSVRSLRRKANEFDLVVLQGINAPHMIWLSQRLERHGAVILDLCDSLALWAQAYHWRVDAFVRFKIWLSGLLLRVGRDGVTCSYTTARDAKADTLAGLSTTPIVIANAYPPGLDDLEPYVGPPVRMVMAADLIAPQNLKALSWFWSAVRTGELELRIPLEIYGPVAPDDELPTGIAYMGWAPRLRDIYDGQTAVFAPTVWGAGIQNKYLEAVLAGRPVVVGRHAAESIPGYTGTLPFASRSELITQLNALQDFAVPLDPGAVVLATESEIRHSLAVVEAMTSSRRERRQAMN
jgi:glycosyl transferase family 1